MIYSLIRLHFLYSLRHNSCIRPEQIPILGVVFLKSKPVLPAHFFNNSILTLQCAQNKIAFHRLLLTLIQVHSWWFLQARSSFTPFDRCRFNNVFLLLFHWTSYFSHSINVLVTLRSRIAHIVIVLFIVWFGRHITILVSFCLCSLRITSCALNIILLFLLFYVFRCKHFGFILWVNIIFFFHFWRLFIKWFSF